MREEGLIVSSKRHRKYNSYQGEISPPVPNKIEQDFHADKPNQKWLTDITEFALPAGKVYLSELVNKMLEQAISQLPKREQPLIHSDRGMLLPMAWLDRTYRKCRFRTLHVKEKGCSLDNAACEGLFGRLKNEMFYYQDWTGFKISQFIDTLNETQKGLKYHLEI